MSIASVPSPANSCPPQLAPNDPSARLKSSSSPVEGKSCGEALGEALEEGLTEGLGETLALALGDSLEDGDTEGDSDDEGLTDALGESEALTLPLGETDALGEGVGLTDGEPTDETERISTTPPTLGEAVLRVNDPLPTVVTASNT